MVLWAAQLAPSAALAGREAPARPAAEDLCQSGGQDASKLAAEGLRRYREAFLLRDPVEQPRAYERAMRCYLRAMELQPAAAGKLSHPLGLVYEKLGRPVEAREAFRRFLAAVPETQRNIGVTQQINEKLRALSAQVGELIVETVPRLAVRVDGRPVGRSPLRDAVVVTPGAHVVIVGDEEVGTLGAEIKVAGGEVRRVDLSAWRSRQEIQREKELALARELGTAPAAAKPPPLHRRWWLWTLVGVAAAGAATAVAVTTTRGGPNLLERVPADNQRDLAGKF
jgi:hypothetical protein